MKNEYTKEECRGAMLSRNRIEKLMFFMIGGSIGAAIGLLFAPKSGREVREDIADLAVKSYEHGVETANNITQRGSELYEIGKGASDDVLEVLTEGAEAIKHEAKRDVRSISKIVENSAERAFGRPGVL
jgi:gas vesicle protein